MDQDSADFETLKRNDPSSMSTMQLHLSGATSFVSLQFLCFPTPNEPNPNRTFFQFFDENEFLLILKDWKKVTIWNVFVWNLDIYMECTSYDLTNVWDCHHFGLNLTPFFIASSLFYPDLGPLTIFWPLMTSNDRFRCHCIRQTLSQNIQREHNSQIFIRCPLLLRLNFDD